MGQVAFQGIRDPGTASVLPECRRPSSSNLMEQHLLPVQTHGRKNLRLQSIHAMKFSHRENHYLFTLFETSKTLEAYS